MPITWTSSSATVAGWKQHSAITDAQGGVDFVLRASNQFPMLALVNEFKAVPVLDDPIERAP